MVRAFHRFTLVDQTGGWGLAVGLRDTYISIHCHALHGDLRAPNGFPTGCVLPRHRPEGPWCTAACVGLAPGARLPATQLQRRFAPPLLVVAAARRPALVHPRDSLCPAGQGRDLTKGRTRDAGAVRISCARQVRPPRPCPATRAAAAAHLDHARGAELQTHTHTGAHLATLRPAALPPPAPRLLNSHPYLPAPSPSLPGRPQDPNARNCHGYRKFVKRALLEDPTKGYLLNDTLVIRYTIELVVSSGEGGEGWAVGWRGDRLHWVGRWPFTHPISVPKPRNHAGSMMPREKHTDGSYVSWEGAGYGEVEGCGGHDSVAHGVCREQRSTSPKA